MCNLHASLHVKSEVWDKKTSIFYSRDIKPILLYYRINGIFRCPSKADRAQNVLQQEWGNFPSTNWNGIYWGLPLQLVQLIKIHFLPHLESFMWEQKFYKNFFKKSHIQTPNGVLLIFKLPFPNGSYRNGVCRAL